MDFLSDRDRLEQGEFRGVAAWQGAMEFSVAIYRLTDGWPRVDPIDLTMDIRRNAVNIPSIIARGFGMGEREALLDCLQTVLDTARQLDAQLGIAARVGYCDGETIVSMRRDLAETVQQIEELARRYQTP